jgi:transcriptional regulator with XRE-family HTH domain
MKRKPLSESDKAAAANLRRIWDEKKRDLGLTQEKAAEAMGFTTQGAVSHYLNGYMPLNTDNLLKFAALLEVPPSAIRPDIDDLLGNALRAEQTRRPMPTLTADQLMVAEMYAVVPPEKRAEMLDQMARNPDRYKALLDALLTEVAHSTVRVGGGAKLSWTGTERRRTKGEEND